jgi:hypothetical protein
MQRLRLVTPCVSRRTSSHKDGTQRLGYAFLAQCVRRAPGNEASRGASDATSFRCCLEQRAMGYDNRATSNRERRATSDDIGTRRSDDIRTRRSDDIRTQRSDARRSEYVSVTRAC